MKRYLRATTLAEVEQNLNSSYGGVVFGAEFCGWAMPPVGDAEKVRKLAASHGVPFIPVTPITREGEFKRVIDWLKPLLADGGEWVANDLGVLSFWAEEGFPGIPIAGRNLSRQQRGPRLRETLEEASPEMASALKGSIFNDPDTVAILVELGVMGIELDALSWGIERPALPDGMTLTLSAPWAPVTWSPDCYFGDGFLGKCNGACLNQTPLRLENDQNSTPLYTRGNAVFSKVDEEAAVNVADSAKADRIFWSPRLPG